MKFQGFQDFSQKVIDFQDFQNQKAVFQGFRDFQGPIDSLTMYKKSFVEILS